MGIVSSSIASYITGGSSELAADIALVRDGRKHLRKRGYDDEGLSNRLEPQKHKAFSAVLTTKIKIEHNGHVDSSMAVVCGVTTDRDKLWPEYRLGRVRSRKQVIG